MTQNEHNLVAAVVGFIIYQFIYHMILKHHPIAKKNMEEMFDMFKKLL